MYEYRQLGIISGDVTRLNELAAEGWRVVAHVPTGDHLYHFLLEREKGDTIRELQTRVAELEPEKRLVSDWECPSCGRVNPGTMRHCPCREDGHE